jgi:hypothetical protein
MCERGHWFTPTVDSLPLRAAPAEHAPAVAAAPQSARRDPRLVAAAGRGPVRHQRVNHRKFVIDPPSRRA